MVFVVETIHRTDGYKHGGEDWERHEISLFHDEEKAYLHAIHEALEEEDVFLKLYDLGAPEDGDLLSWLRSRNHKMMNNEDLFDCAIWPLFDKAGEYICSPSFEVKVYEREIR